MDDAEAVELLRSLDVPMADAMPSAHTPLDEEPSSHSIFPWDKLPIEIKTMICHLCIIDDGHAPELAGPPAAEKKEAQQDTTQASMHQPINPVIQLMPANHLPFISMQHVFGKPGYASAMFYQALPTSVPTFAPVKQIFNLASGLEIAFPSIPHNALPELMIAILKTPHGSIFEIQHSPLPATPVTAPIFTHAQRVLRQTWGLTFQLTPMGPAPLQAQHLAATSSGQTNPRPPRELFFISKAHVATQIFKIPGFRVPFAALSRDLHYALLPASVNDRIAPLGIRGYMPNGYGLPTHASPLLSGTVYEIPFDEDNDSDNDSADEDEDDDDDFIDENTLAKGYESSQYQQSGGIAVLKMATWKASNLFFTCSSIWAQTAHIFHHKTRFVIELPELDLFSASPQARLGVDQDATSTPSEARDTTETESNEHGLDFWFKWPQSNESNGMCASIPLLHLRFLLPAHPAFIFDVDYDGAVKVRLLEYSRYKRNLNNLVHPQGVHTIAARLQGQLTKELKKRSRWDRGFGQAEIDFVTENMSKWWNKLPPSSREMTCQCGEHV